MVRYELTDPEWERIEPLLPPAHTGKRGHPYSQHRPVLNGILWILRSGAPWQDLPARYPPRSTCHDRLKRWQQDGTWTRILSALQAAEDQQGNVVWVNCAVDGSNVRAHQDAAGARKQKKGRGAGRTTIVVVSVGGSPAHRRRRPGSGA